MKKLKPISRILIAVSALLMASAYYVPLWQILMWAPQYPEGLQMKIWIDNITGDVRIISALNHYIGMKHIEVSMFPEFSYMKYVVAILIGIGLFVVIINRRAALVGYASLIIAAGVAALVDFYIWGYQYGHNLDPRAPIVVPGMSYQPPLIGTKQLLNFTAFSGPDIGGWIFLVSGVIAIAILVFEILKSRKGTVTSGNTRHAISFAAVITVLLTSCSTKPQAIAYGKDACHSCKMTMVDEKFGAEIVTKKGKIYKFDDMNCMINFFNGGDVDENDVAHLLVVDYSKPAQFIDARNALYIKSKEIKSPMASGVAAFETKPELDQFNKNWRGMLLSWGELRTQYK